MKNQINLKINKRIYQFESVPCCVCNSEKFIILSNKDRYGLYMPVVICQKCGLIQTNPRMTQESYNSFYNLEYRKLYGGVKKPTKEFFKNQYLRGKKIYTYLQNNDTLSKSLSDLFIFEVGCGAGGILQYFQKKGSRIQGIDIGEKYIEFGRKNFALDLMVGKLPNISLDTSPDVIIYSHVLEHILYLKKELTCIYNLLSDNGVIYIEIPGIKNLKKNYNNDFLRFLQNAHVYHFTLNTLKNLLETNGFKMIIGDESIRSIFKKVKQKGTNNIQITNEYFNVMNFLNRQENLLLLYRINYFLGIIKNNVQYLNIRRLLIFLKNSLINICKKITF